MRPSTLPTSSIASNSYASSSSIGKMAGYSIPGVGLSSNNLNKPYPSSKVPLPLGSSGSPSTYRPSNPSHNSKPGSSPSTLIFQSKTLIVFQNYDSKTLLSSECTKQSHLLLSVLVCFAELHKQVLPSYSTCRVPERWRS